MAVEIERKFLIKTEEWRTSITKSMRLSQGYLSNNEQASVRIRIQDDDANINIKSMTIGIERQEYEYAIPLPDAELMLHQLCFPPIIEKVRHHVEHEGHLWEIDEFGGENGGLIVAEIELQSVDELFTHPEWLGKEVSAHKRYYNVSLAQYPYSQWSACEKSGENCDE